MAIFLLIVSLLLFVGLVVAHEFGHFIMARRNGVDVEEFGLGFPPKAFSRKTKDGFIFSINWLPLGGFVRLKGEHDADTEKGSYGVASLWAKTKIMAAGVVMNLLVAFVLFTVLALMGMPKLVDNQFSIASDTKVVQNRVLVDAVEAGSPADQIGIKPNDQLIKIGSVGHNLQDISSASNLPQLTKQYAGQKVEVVYVRGSKQYQSTTTLLSTQAVTNASKNGPKGYFGVVPSSFSLIRSTWSAPIVALGLMKQFTILTFQGLGGVIVNLGHGHVSKATSQVTGPVGIFFLLKNVSQLGFPFVLSIIALISLTLAIMNILPIPALDGGHLFVTLITNLFHKRLNQSTEEWIHGTGFAFLLILVALITVADVRSRRFF